ncbi:nitronate monooxygenase family protein [Paraburkholderia sp. MM5384-R2]|uniref:NAD(P)H-dependent flavin oxidoreductase n=1 Tax=Paraburkholderia sp. MM5384-R2 TaxID=2723097 RepID=UPI0016219FE5|nr:nitronate monooxygenase [Paraburkholderia sp. MM5384-R2]MBB5499722.1 nitronate monooxygenase [Paraburkholderia sp. MM5384-R2]
MKPYVNRITELLGIQYPIIQGGMRWVARAELAAAVANAGGLGFISAHTHASADALAREIDRVRSLTDKPFGVNLTVLGANVGLDYDAYVRTIVSQGVQVVETAGSNPAKYIAEFKVHGVKVVHKCVTVRHAVKAESLGADAVSIDGFECAGHPGEDDIPGLILIPAAADKLKVPILASGGFADGRGLMAALALGADGINMGTRFMLTQESPVHPAIKQRLLEASERDTVLVGRSIGDSSRVVRNSVSLAALELERAGNVTRSDLYALTEAQRWMDAFVTGEVEGGAFPAGIVTGLIHDLPTCAELIGRIVKEAAAIAQRQLGFSAALA